LSEENLKNKAATVLLKKNYTLKDIQKMRKGALKKAEYCIWPAVPQTVQMQKRIKNNFAKP